MAILVSANRISKSFSVRPLFKELTFAIEIGERIGLIGANGAGKSTILKILAGLGDPDSGDISLQKGLCVGYLEQSPKLPQDLSIEETILSGTPDPSAWESISLAQEFMSKLDLDRSRFSPETKVGTLSGGWQKRVALARELVKEPELLLLDEPTNHLDIESILWLENFLIRTTMAVVIVTHDRLFLQNTSNRIIEIGKQYAEGLLNVRGSYADYLDLRESLLSVQKREESILKNRLRHETEWLRRGPKARTTKQQARIDRAQDLKDDVAELAFRNRTREVDLDFQSSDRKPKRLLEAKAITKTYGNKTLFKNLDLFLGPGSRVGLLGVNGSGKSTLIRCLLGEENVDAGSVFQSDGLTVAYFEQKRESLDPEKTVLKTLCPAGDHVNYRGHLIHIRSYLDRFLFSPEQVDMKVAYLSGGEQSRLLIARLMLREASLLVLDEPTNDLDIETLDVLEDCLTEFDGAILLVTHDRYFLDQVATEILAFNPDLQHLTSFAGLAQWESWTQAQMDSKKTKKAVASPSSDSTDSTTTDKNKKRKLNFNETRELSMMEANIQKAESKMAALQREVNDPINQSNSAKLAELCQHIADTQAEIDRLYSRWTELES